MVVAIGIAVTSTVVEEPGPALLEGMIPSGEFISHRCVSKGVDVISTCNSSVKRIRLRYANKLYKIIRLYKIIKDYQRKLGSNFRVTNNFFLGAIDYDEGW